MRILWLAKGPGFDCPKRWAPYEMLGGCRGSEADPRLDIATPFGLLGYFIYSNLCQRVWFGSLYARTAQLG